MAALLEALVAPRRPPILGRSKQSQVLRM